MLKQEISIALACSDSGDDEHIPDFAKRRWSGLQRAMEQLDLFTPALYATTFKDLSEDSLTTALSEVARAFATSCSAYLDATLQAHPWFAKLHSKKKTCGPRRSQNSLQSRWDG